MANLERIGCHIPTFQTGQASLPLAYIVREYNLPLPNVQYAMTHVQLVACAILQGPEYNVNNGHHF
jgi:hypothetical protein